MKMNVKKAALTAASLGLWLLSMFVDSKQSQMDFDEAFDQRYAETRLAEQRYIRELQQKRLEEMNSKVPSEKKEEE